MKLLTADEIDQLVLIVQNNKMSNGSGFPLLDMPRMVATLKAHSDWARELTLLGSKTIEELAQEAGINVEPEKHELRKFCWAVSAAFRFEGSMRQIGRFGAFEESDCPMPEVQKVEQWLRRKCGLPLDKPIEKEMV
jgi:hypothetical protein